MGFEDGTWFSVARVVIICWMFGSRGILPLEHDSETVDFKEGGESTFTISVFTTCFSVLLLSSPLESEGRFFSRMMLWDFGVVLSFQARSRDDAPFSFFFNSLHCWSWKVFSMIGKWLLFPPTVGASVFSDR